MLKDLEKTFKFDLQLFADEDGEGNEGNDKGKKDEDPNDVVKDKKEDEYSDLEKIKKAVESDEVSSELLKKVVNDLIEDSKKYRNLSRDRLHEVMTEKEKLKKIEEEQEETKVESLKKKEEYKKLVEDMEPKLKVLTDDASKTQTFFDDLLEKKKQQIPDEYKDLIPESIDIRDKINWIDNFLSKLPGDKKTEEKKVDVNAGKTGPNKSEEDKSKKPSESKIREELQGAKNMNEFQQILAKYGRKI